jgi:3-oxoacyl-[acyl-carrier-protein] synthase-3
MDGAAVLKFSTREVLSSIEQAIQDSGLTKKDIDLFLFHQASNLVLDTLQKKLDISDSQLPRNLKEIGNTTSSSIPILINELLQKGQLQKGQTILMSGFGVGLSWATCVIKI